MDVTDARARELVEALLESDPAAMALGMTLGSISAGRVELSQLVTPAMVNGHAIVHGGYVFLLADTAFAYCCASLERLSVTRTADIAFIAPARVASTMLATATVRANYGRNLICDVRITDEGGALLAEFRGHGTRTAA
ncbi:MAG TPA: hotdog fold thioesterase [Galbitalea sp.]